jgi:hypothetical protein
MLDRKSTHLYLLAFGFAATALACGGGSSSTSSPTAAADVNPAVAAPVAAAPSAAAAATINGTVQASGVAGAALGTVHALSSGVRVSVVGTAITTMADGSGRFTLSNVPAGSVQLRFEGSGCDARLAIDGLQSGQTLTITVHVSGSSATMTTGDDEDGELSGTVESVGSGRLVVSGKTVTVDASTRILGDKGVALTLADVKVGARVEVEGTRQADGSILATKITLDH